MKKKTRKDKLKFKNKMRKQQESVLSHERNNLEPYAGVTEGMAEYSTKIGCSKLPLCHTQTSYI